MNTMQVLCFLKAAQCLSFTESAIELHISQPAFSHNIHALEDEWGIKLFIRNKKNKGTCLTPAGTAMYAGLTDMKEQFENLLQKAKSIHAGKSGTLSIGLLSSDRIDERTLTLLDRFQADNPDIDLSLRRGSHSELLQRLYDKTLDLAVMLKLDVADKPWLDYEKLYSVESVMILTLNHPLAHKADVKLADFKDELFVNVSTRESPTINALLMQECQKVGFTPKTLDAPDVNGQILHLESGKGVAIGSINNIAVFNSRIGVVHLPELNPLDLVLAWNNSNSNLCIPNFVSSYELIE